MQRFSAFRSGIKVLLQLEPSTPKNEQSPAIQTLSKGFIFLKNNSVTNNEIYLYFLDNSNIYLKDKYTKKY